MLRITRATIPRRLERWDTCGKLHRGAWLILSRSAVAITRTQANFFGVSFSALGLTKHSLAEFMTTAMATTSPRQAFFSRFSRQAVKTLACPSTTSTNKHPPPVILLTGGLRTYDIFCDVLTQGHAQLIGIGRTSVLCPELPRLLAESIARHRAWDDRPDGPFPTFLREPLREPDLRLPGPINIALKYVPLPKLIGAGVGMAWYTVQMRRIAKGQSIDYALGGLGAIVEMWVPQWTFGRTLTMGWFSIIILVVVLGALL